MLYPSLSGILCVDWKMIRLVFGEDALVFGEPLPLARVWEVRCQSHSKNSLARDSKKMKMAESPNGVTEIFWRAEGQKGWCSCQRVCHHGPKPPMPLVVAADVAVRHGARLCLRFVEELCWLFLFHVNKVQRCAYFYTHRSNDGILGIARKLLIRRDNL